MLTVEEILEIMGGEPDEVIDCDDGFVMSWGAQELNALFNEDKEEC